MLHEDLNPVQDNRHIFSVSELNQAAKDILETALPNLWLEGEISNLAQPSSGHIYLTLKDKSAQIRAAMFKGRNRRLSFAEYCQSATAQALEDYARLLEKNMPEMLSLLSHSLNPAPKLAPL